jgi:hypothetical protein
VQTRNADATPSATPTTIAWISRSRGIETPRSVIERLSQKLKNRLIGAREIGDCSHLGTPAVAAHGREQFKRQGAMWLARKENGVCRRVRVGVDVPKDWSHAER